MRAFLPLLLVAALVLPGCYHARIETGARPGPIQIDRPFALSFVYGLVPPPTVETMEKCPAGVAVVETQQSFLNGLVSALTAGLVTPMQITVTCADDRMGAAETEADDVAVAGDAETEAVVEAIGGAADRAVASGEPVYVRFE